MRIIGWTGSKRQTGQLKTLAPRATSAFDLLVMMNR
jgi:hypothetical protein